MPTPRVQRGELRGLHRLADGQFGVVYEVRGTMPRGVQHLRAYKEFKDRPTADAVRNMQELIAFHETASPAIRRLLATGTTWPGVIVDQGRAPVGFLMPLVPARFFPDQRLPSGKVEPNKLDAQWLFRDDEECREAAMPVPTADDLPLRLALCLKLARTFAALHARGFVYGDLSQRNVLFSVTSPATTVLVDCDEIQSPSAPRIAQGTTPDWAPPESGPQSTATDCYKLALFVVRVLNPGEFASQVKDPAAAGAALGAPGVALATRTLGADPRHRGTAAEWAALLASTLRSLTSPPEIVSAEVDDTLVFHGEHVLVRWSVRDADEVLLTAPDGTRFRTDQLDGCAPIVANRSGAIHIQAVNRFGDTAVQTSSVRVFSPPVIEHVTVPAPTLPGLRTVVLERLSGVSSMSRHERAATPRPAEILAAVPSVASLRKVTAAAAAPDELLELIAVGHGMTAAITSELRRATELVTAGVADATAEHLHRQGDLR